MTTIRKILLGAGSAALLAGLATSASAQSNTSSASASVNASIIQPITITNNANLAFGTIARPASGSSTVTIGTSTSAGPISITGAGGASAIGSGSSRGQFTVAGDAGRLYTLSGGGTSAFDLTRSGGTEVLAFTPNIVAASGTLGTLSGTAGSFASGSQVLNAGGSITVTDATVPGAYAGTMNLTVTYN